MTKILLSDRDNFIREYLALELRQAGYRVTTTSTGQELLKVIEVARPNLVVLDTELGARNGLDLLQSIRNKYYDLPVIIFSDQHQYRQDPRTLAADYFVSKSLGINELKVKISMALEAHESTPLLAAS
jgi:DNA-binding response OmpR family regulator